MKAKSIILLVFFSFALASSFVSCGGGGSKTDGEQKEKKTKVTNNSGSEDCSDISKMIVYIDASASIKGYFSDGSDGKFGNAITNLAQYKGLNSPVYFWGDKTRVNTSVDAKGGVNASLRARSGYGQDSYFNKMFQSMAQLITNDSVDAACLVTDGIYGVGNDLTRKDSEHAVKTLPDFKGEIKNVFSGKNLAVGFFKLSGKFSANSKGYAYITYQNVNISPISIDNRPFYVIVIGKPEKVNSFAKNNELGADLSLVLGGHNINMHNSYKLSDPKHFDKDNVWKGNKNDSETNLCVKFPSCIGNDNYIKDNITVTLNGKEINDFAVSNSRLSITEEIEKNASVRPKKDSEFRVVIKNSIPKEWTNLYNEDDKSIKSNASIQGQTFGLKYLLEGLLEGTCSDNLVDISFKFKK